MKLNQALNFVVNIETAAGQTVHAHCTPLQPETFDQYFLLIGKTYSSLMEEGLGAAAGPRVAAKVMQRLSIAMETAPGRPGIGQAYNAIMDEIKRTTAIVTAGQSNVLLEEAVGKGLIDKQDRDILENLLVFFTVVSAIMLPADARQMMAATCAVWDAQMSSLNSTAFKDSFKKSTTPASSGVTVADSLVPS